MSKGKGKPKTPTNTNLPNTGAWEASLTSTLVNDEDLRVKVFLFSPNKVEDKLQLQLLSGGVETNVRQKFVYIDRDTLLAQGREYGKSKDVASKTAFPEVFTLIKANEELVPSATLAKLLKVKVVEYREAELARRDELVKAKSGNSSRSPAKSASPDKGKKDKKGGKKSPVKKDAVSIDPEADIPRGRCPLKKRGEEKEEPPKIDDYPEGGPDLYVVCSGFEQADFLGECSKVKLPITALVRTSTEQYSAGFGFMEHISSFNQGTKFRRVQVAVDDNSPDEMESRARAHQELVDGFWSAIREQATEVPLPSWLEEVGFEELSLPRVELDAELKKDTQRMEQVKLGVYDIFAKKVYQILASYSQFLQYNKGMELVDVVDLSERNEEGALVRPLNMSYYNKLISLLPHESASHVSVLNCILEQVCEEQQETMKEIKETTEDPVKKQLGLLVQGLPLSLTQQNEFEGFLSLKSNTKKEDDQPIVLKEGDQLASQTFHLAPEQYPLNDSSLLKQSMTNTLLELPETRPEILAKIQSVAYERESFCGEATQAVVSKALRQFAFEGINPEDSSYGISPLKRPEEVFWDVEMLLNSRSYSDESLAKLRTANIPVCNGKLDRYTYRTSYEKDAFVQVLEEAAYQYPYCERVYERHEHAMLLLFHAGCNARRFTSTGWSERVHTNIGFHYFLDRTAGPFSDLLGLLPALTPPAPSTPLDPSGPPTPVTPVESASPVPEFVPPPNRLEGFKKRSELKEEEKERESSGKKGGKNAPKSPRKGSASPKRQSPSKSPKRSGSRQSSAKSERAKVEFEPIVPEPEMDIVLEEEPKSIFVGFNLPNQIFQATGEVSHCHPADGSLVRVERWGFEGAAPRSRVSLLKGGHVLSLNYDLKSEMDLRRELKEQEERERELAKERAAAEEAAAAAAVAESKAPTEAASAEEIAEDSVCASEPAPEPPSKTPLAKGASFNAHLKNGLCMSFRAPESGAVSSAHPLLSVSVPTGLVLTYCQQDDASDFFMLRQRYEGGTALKHPCEAVQAKVTSEEVSRLYLSNGSVVKHMKNGQTVILYPDGGYSIRHLEPAPTPAKTPASAREDPITDGEGTPGPEGGEETPAPPPAHLQWEVTKEDGAREHVLSDGSVKEVEPLLSYTATDPESHEVLFTRIDSILSVTRPDGTRIVDHTDGTRITTTTTDDGTPNYKIECTGYATVRFTPSASEATLGRGAVVRSAERNSSFTITEEGGATLTADPFSSTVTLTDSSLPETDDSVAAHVLGTVRDIGSLPFGDLGVHTFSLAEETCYSHTDLAGNIFTVGYEGTIATEQPDTHVVQHLDHFYRGKNLPPHYQIEERFKPPMRLFVVHSDQTGTELFDGNAYERILGACAKNPDVVKVEEDVESDNLAKGITFLTPFYKSPGGKWSCDFEEGNIVPEGLVYNGAVKPAAQIIGGWEKRVSSPVVVEPELPPAIHYHQVIEESPIDDYHRELVVNGIKAHANWTVERELNASSASGQDTRSETEKKSADTLATKVGRKASITQTPHQVRTLWRSESIQKFRIPTIEDWCAVGQEESDCLLSEGEEEEMGEGLGGGAEEMMETPPPDPEKLEQRRNTVDVVTRKYSTAVFQNPFKMKMKLKKGIIPQAMWDQITREKMEVSVLKSDIRNLRVPPYFESKFGLAFLESLKAGPDVDELSKVVPTPPIIPSSSEKSLDGGKGESLSTSMILIDEDPQGSSVSLGEGQVGSTPRPFNPTPNVAVGKTEETKAPDQLSASPAVRADSNTPQHTRNLSPHQEEDFTTATNDVLSSRQNSKPASGTVKSLFVDAKGDVRRDRVKIPRSIKGYKPGSERNLRFLEQEEPVRRGVKTSSVLAASKRKEVTELRGFQVYPPEVSFGVLCPNGSYASTVTLKNVGIDSCRFQIKCPKNRDGLSVLLHTDTNFVAAGMSVKFDVCLTASDVTDIGHVVHDVTIITEMEIFKLPVRATILPVQEYDERSRSGTLKKLPVNIKIIDVNSMGTTPTTGVRESDTPYSSDWYSTITYS